MVLRWRQIAAQSDQSSRDDLRTRSGASGSPHGSMGRNSRERREDGADDHPNEPANSESVLGEPAAEAQSPRGAAASGGIPGTWVFPAEVDRKRIPGATQ